MNKKYFDDDFAEADGMFGVIPISQIAEITQISTHTLRSRCKKLGISTATKARGRPMASKQINQLMRQWR